MSSAFAGHPHVEVTAVGPAPPERYHIVYRVPGLHRTGDNRLIKADTHAVEIQLPGGYPRDKPYCTTRAPIFHPNFGSHICIADFWSPSQSLVDIVVQIGQMIQYQSYNTSSPLNALAARWAAEHVNRLPVGDHGLTSAAPEIRLA